MLRHKPLRQAIAPDVLDYLNRRGHGSPTLGRTGYSDGELSRLVHAARSDVAAICDRIDAGQRLLDSWSTDPTALGNTDAIVGAQLNQIAESVVVPRIPGLSVSLERPPRTAMARRLFVTREDREPLLILLAAITGHL